MSDFLGQAASLFDRKPRAFFLAACLISGASPMTGCGESTSGNQVQVTDEAKAQIQARRDTYSKQPKRSAPSAGKSAKPRQ